MAFFTSVAKYLLFAINLVFVVGGGAFILYGALMVNWFHNYTQFFQKNYDFLPSFLISLGVIMFVAALLGLIASLKSHYRLMTLFTGVCLLLFVVQVVGIVYLFKYKKTIINFLNKRLESGFKLYERDIDVTLLYNKIQKALRCCGYKSMDEDFRNRKAPISCCYKIENQKCAQGSYYKRGCKEAVSQLFKDNSTIIYLILSIFVGTQVVSLICAFFLIYAFRHDFETV